MKILIIGGSAGGASVAARLRRLSEQHNIILFEQSDTISYATCGIPYYLGGVIKDRDRLFVVDRTDFYQILNIDVRTRTEVISIDREKKCIYVREIETDYYYCEFYDKLILATGGKPNKLNIKGVDGPQVFTVRSAADTDAINDFINDNKCRRAVIIGAGFIGMEVCENLHNLGMEITIVGSSDQIMDGWDKEMSNAIHKHIIDKQVAIALNQQVAEIREDKTILSDKRSLPSDIVILAIGIKPNINLAKSCELDIGKHGGICVDDFMRTSDKSIYALGDTVEVRSRITDVTTLVPLAGLAHKQSRIVAGHLCGKSERFKATKMTAIAKVFDQTLAATGASEKQLIQSKIPFLKSYVDLPSHASFYPGAHPITIKLLFCPKSEKILGAQIAGGAGVDKRIDVLATLVHLGSTVRELVDLELAYAPPFSSAKDPINIAGMVACNMLDEDYQVVHWDELHNHRFKDSIIIDVRTAEEFSIRSIDGAINIPLNSLRSRLPKIPLNKTIIVFCQFGKKGYFASRILKQHGHLKVYNLSGGFKVYKQGIADFSQMSLPKAPESLIEKLNLKDEVTQERASTNSIILDDVDFIEIDACGLACPGPIMKLTKTVKKANKGAIIKIMTTDTGFCDDVELWCTRKGHKLINIDKSISPSVTVVQKC